MAVDELAVLNGRARDDTTAARTYLGRMAHVEGGEGVLNVCLAGHQEAYRSLSDWLAKVADPTTHPSRPTSPSCSP